MANAEHVAILKQGVEVWNKWREENPDVRPDLSGTNLDGKDFRILLTDEGDFAVAEAYALNSLKPRSLGVITGSGIDFSGTDLSESNLELVNLRWADLRGANLTRANILHADFSGANLRCANLSRTSLLETNLSGANLDNANLTRASLRGSILTNVDLSTVEGLNLIWHHGPTFIGIETIYRSKGQIPEVFLRGCGVPDSMITFARSLVESAQPIDYYSCFISHSGEDRVFCDRLYADLQANEVRTWYFWEDARWGRGVWGEIDRGIKLYDKVVVVCSQNSLQSGAVLREIERALVREDADKDEKDVLFPIRIDDYIFEQWEHPRKVDVISKVVGDFTNWEAPDSYQEALERLLRDLKAED